VNDQKTEKIIGILNEIVQILRLGQTDVAWSHYDTVDEAVADLNAHVERLRSGDLSGMFDLRMLFAPTGSLQEISINSGWGDEFLVISEQFDKAVKGIA
jgi:hypothetical protein